MRVLFVCATGGFGRQQLGGAERFLVEMLPEFAQHMEVAAVVPEGAVAAALRASGIQLFLSGPKRRVDSSYRTAIRAVVREFRPDVVSTHLLSAAMHTRSLTAREIPSSRLVVTLHNSLRQYVETSTGRMRARAQFNLALDRVQRCARKHTSVAVSKYEANELESVPVGGPVRCIPNPLPRGFQGVLERDKAVARQSLGLPQSGRVFAFVGRMEFEKGADLLDSIATYLDDGDLLAAFGGGVIQPSGGRVATMGRTGSPELVWAAADAVVVPSRVESFGRVALEAAASGTPVVHTGIGGLHELLARGEGVLAYTTPLDPRELARNLIAASGEDIAREELRTVLAKEYAAQYAFQTKVDEWCTLLLELAGETA